MWLCTPKNEQRLYDKNVLKQNYFPPVYFTLRACGKCLILNALLAGMRINLEAHVLQLLSLLFAGFWVVHTHKRIYGTLYPIYALGLVHFNLHWRRPTGSSLVKLTSTTYYVYGEWLAWRSYFLQTQSHRVDAITRSPYIDRILLILNFITSKVVSDIHLCRR